MSNFIFLCPHCSGEFEAQEDWCGMEAECPNCNNSVTINKPSRPILSPVVSKKTEESSKFTFICPECNAEKEMDTEAIGTTIECEGCCEEVKVLVPEFKNCPHCKQEVKVKAEVCKHCKKNFSEIQTKPQQTKPTLEATEKKCPHCKQEVKVKAKICKHCKKNLTEIQTTPASPATEKKCPHCGKSIKKEAILCKHCKTNLTNSENKVSTPPQTNFEGMVPPGFENKKITLYNVTSIKEPEKYGGMSAVKLRKLSLFALTAFILGMRYPMAGFIAPLGYIIAVSIRPPKSQRTRIWSLQEKNLLITGIIISILVLSTLVAYIGALIYLVFKGVTGGYHAYGL